MSPRIPERIIFPANPTKQRLVLKTSRVFVCKIKLYKIKFLQAVVLLIKLNSTHDPFSFRWIQIAKKIIAKSKRESDQSKGAPQPRQSTFPNPSRPTGFPTPPNVLAHNGMFVTNQSKHPMFPASSTFNGSENDLSLNYNSINRGKYGAYSPQTSRIRYSPEGRSSPEVHMYKTRVIYHSRQDCASDHEASV